MAETARQNEEVEQFMVAKAGFSFTGEDRLLCGIDEAADGIKDSAKH